eukprot:TRINITY_DN22185_c0_g1_i1.p1 TRINITY_DN22185_c0_g1~~TRINITY_DN22185_c0_g1_i1.p1  ORF type:complete len:834 (+),score=185.10 TRINITY_DN22185_c0_g1_i1:243-2744(+)
MEEEPEDRTEERIRTSPLSRLINLEKFGGALLLSSACKNVIVVDEFDPGLDDNKPPPPVLEAGAPPREGGDHDRCVPGGVYREERMSVYREQTLIGIELIAAHLEELGVEPERIHFADYADEAPAEDPATVICNFLHALQPGRPEALLYFVGPSAPAGEWAFDWEDAEGQLQSFLVAPHLIEPGPGEKPLGYAGLRMVISDAPYTADMWGVATPHLIGAAAWHQDAMPGGDGGPALARWLTGRWPGPPLEGTVFFERPISVNLCDLPAYTGLFWEAAPPATPQEASRLLWQVQTFVGACTRQQKWVESNEEFAARGGIHVVAKIVEKHGAHADATLMMQCWWLLHSLASKSAASRWVCQMAVTLRIALDVGAARCEDSFDLVAVLLDFATTCLRKCDRCRASCKHGRRERSLLLGIVLRVVGGGVTLNPAELHDTQAAAGACRAVAQLANDEEFDERDETDRKVVDALVRTLLFDWGSTGGEVKRSAAEALKLFALKSSLVKAKLTQVAMAGPRFLRVLEDAEPAVAAQMLALTRSLAVVDGPEPAPQPDGSHSPKGAGGLALERKHPPALPSELPEVVVYCLSRYPEVMAVQRWGISILGALAAKQFVWTDSVGEGIATCLLWALGTDKLKHPLVVDQECLFCAHALLMHPNSGGRLRLQQPDCKLAHFVAGAVSRAAQASDAGNATIALEALRWGITVMGLLAAAPGGPAHVAPHIGAIVSAVLAPYCNEVTALAGIEALSIVLSGCMPAKEALRPDQKRLVHSLQTRARGLPQASRERMEAWVMVLLEALGAVKALNAEDEPNTDWKNPDSDEEEDEVFPYDLEQAAKKK